MRSAVPTPLPVEPQEVAALLTVLHLLAAQEIAPFTFERCFDGATGRGMPHIELHSRDFAPAARVLDVKPRVRWGPVNISATAVVSVLGQPVRLATSYRVDEGDIPF